MTYISSATLTAPLRQSILKTQSALVAAQQEISTGAPADLGLTLGARSGGAVSLKVEIDRLGAFSTSNGFAATRLDTTANTLGTLVTSARSISAALVSATSAGGSTSALPTVAQTALKGLMAGLNVSVGDQYVFGGIKLQAAPIGDYFAGNSTAKQAVDSSFQAVFGFSQTDASTASISGGDMKAYLDNQFDSNFSTGAWQANWSSASNETMQTAISSSQSVATSVSANETAFRQLAEAYAMLGEFANPNFSDDARAAVVSKASSLVNSALAGLTNLQSGVGVTQAAIASANDSLSAQVTMLKTNVSDLESVDTYALSSRVTILQTQLEASYELTSRLQKLSLTNYLG